MIENILRHFSDLPDRRVNRTKLHSLVDIVTVVLCGLLAGVDNFVQIELWAELNEAWFRRFLKLENGIPSHDTMGRVFSMLDPVEFQRRFLSLVQTLSTGAVEKVVAIDGKTLRASRDEGSGKKPLHMVSAWSAENRAVLGQLRTEEKSNEITAIPQLLETLSISGATVTIDAMGTQREIAAAIVDKGAHYVLALKDNQALFAADVTAYFDRALADATRAVLLPFHESVDKTGGRIETRRIWVSSRAPLIKRYGEEWSCLSSIAKVESIRLINGKETTEHRYYISSNPGDDAADFAKTIRAHWSIENQLHWMLDVVFDEDRCRVRKDNAPENLAILRHIAIGLHNRHGNVVDVGRRKAKIGLANRRQLAAWHKPYLEKLLGMVPAES